MAPPKFEFRLTHGDIVMLSGDLFDPRDKDEKGDPVDDSLWKLAKTPSHNPGAEPWTQDEIIYAIYRENPTDQRFNDVCTKEQPSGGAWAMYPRKFSSSVIKRVEDRYLRLATKNRDHFSHPDEKQKGIGGERDSNGGGYHALHEDALWRAYEGAHGDTGAGEAFAREAAAEHFLTDAFSAGHMRTPRASMQQYWNARYPRFSESVQHVFVEGMATELESQTMGGILPQFDPVLEAKVKGQVGAMFGSVQLSFGDIISKVAHDQDNDHGVWVTNDRNEKWKAYGDGHMYEADKDNQTPQKTREAVKLGVDDIRAAESLGRADRAGTMKTREELLAAIRGGNAKYAPETIVPRADPARLADNGVQNWTAGSFQELWSTPVRSDRTETYGQMISLALSPGGSFYSMLSSKVSSVPADSNGYHPRAAFEAFLKKLEKDPRFYFFMILDGAG